MMMYDDLIKQLRYCSDATTCRQCIWKTECCPTDMQKKAADAIEELRKAVLRLENESGIYDELPVVYIYPTKWIPVKERLPNPKDLVLVCNEFGGVHYGYFESNKQWYTANNWLYDAWTVMSNVTHWMPLPEPPKDGEA